MSFSNIIKSQALPTSFYTQIGKTNISKQGNQNFVEAKIKWNNKTYAFKWCSSLNEEGIQTELKNKINTMLILGMRYNIGEKTSALKYNLANNNIEKTYKDNTTKKITLDFDDKLASLENRLAAKPELPQEQITHLQERQKVIAWSKDRFQEINLPVQPKPRNDLQLEQQRIAPTLKVTKDTKDSTQEEQNEQKKTLTQTTAATTSSSLPSAYPIKEMPVHSDASYEVIYSPPVHSDASYEVIYSDEHVKNGPATTATSLSNPVTHIEIDPNMTHAIPFAQTLSNPVKEIPLSVTANDSQSRGRFKPIEIDTQTTTTTIPNEKEAVNNKEPKKREKTRTKRKKPAIPNEKEAINKEEPKKREKTRTKRKKRVIQNEAVKMEESVKNDTPMWHTNFFKNLYKDYPLQTPIEITSSQSSSKPVIQNEKEALKMEESVKNDIPLWHTNFFKKLYPLTHTPTSGLDWIQMEEVEDVTKNA